MAYQQNLFIPFATSSANPQSKPENCGSREMYPNNSHSSSNVNVPAFISIAWKFLILDTFTYQSMIPEFHKVDECKRVFSYTALEYLSTR